MNLEKEEIKDVGLGNHLFGQKTPMEAVKTAVKRANDKVEGDRLMRARRHARVDTAEQKILAINAARAAARAAHDATDSEEPFDPAPFDAEIAKWEGELQSRIELRDKQDEVLEA